MSARIIDGRVAAASVREQVEQDLGTLGGPPPGLGVVLVGDDPGSRVYVSMKRKTCRQLGIHSAERTLPASAGIEEVLSAIDAYNQDPLIDGILVQLPLPPALDTASILDHVDPAKDVDCFHPVNVGRLVLDRPGIRPCTPAGVLHLLDTIGFDPAGKRACVIGRSAIVGKPVALMLLARHMTVTLCHSRTRDLAGEVGRADLVVAAVGSPGLIRGEWIRPGAVVIDVGTNRVGDRLVGDVDPESARERASFITPVPGGVGPMTIAMLMANTVELARRRRSGAAGSCRE